VELNQKGWELAVRRIIMAESAKGIFDLRNATLVFGVLGEADGSDSSRCTEI